MDPTTTATPEGRGTPRVIQYKTVRAANLAQVRAEEEEAARIRAEAAQNEPVIAGLAALVRQHWQTARDARQLTVETRMLQSLRAKRSEYDPQKLQQIIAAGGSDVFASLTSLKCRAASSWLKDVLSAGGTEKPWGIQPTPVPELPPEVNEQVVASIVQPLTQMIMTAGDVPQEQVKEMLAAARDQAQNEILEKARQTAERLERKMEDQLVEGGFVEAFNQFIDDITVFPSAFLKGPVVRVKPKLKWVQGPDGTWSSQVVNYHCLEWERVSPFDIYPSPEAETVDDGFLIEKHMLYRHQLQELIGVEGYDAEAIKMVLTDYGNGGLRSWLYEDLAQAEAEGKSTVSLVTNPEGRIDALQYWGHVSGQMLIDRGMDPGKVDPLKEYCCEVWVIGPYVIKAVLNYDPLGRKPYYKASYEEVPGSFWGNATPDLIRDAQQVVNAALRALVNNMGIASGPQVQVNVDRLPPGEDIEQLHPWKIWQVKSDPQGPGGSQRAVEFFQPDSRAAELIAIIERFTAMADEWSAIPRYLTGDAPGGAGRTASGLSMLMSNAGKGLKQVLGNIDNKVLYPLLQRLHFWNMQYGSDPDLKAGDVAIVARGANALITKETAAVRRSEFLAATNNPVDLQIIGVEGRAELLRAAVKGLDVNPDRVVPSREMLRAKALVMQALTQEQESGQKTGQQPAGKPPDSPTPASAEGGPQTGQKTGQQPVPGGPSPSGQALMDGSPQVDNYSPPRQ